MAERGSHRQSSTSSRHSPVRRQSQPNNISNPDIFSDDFALEPLIVADGFRPSSPHNDDATPILTGPIAPRRSAGHRPTSFHNSPIRNSIIKKKPPQGHGAAGSSTSQHHLLNLQPPQRTPSGTSISATSERPPSTLSTFSMPTTQTPYQGATGPSYPYGMYPQDISINRTSTVSTIRPPERSYNGPSGPMHPYGMYPQNIVPEGEVVSPIDPAAPSVPLASVGFPGLEQQYTRRLGPDGEDVDDIIGPDGHTEQLPPYTRFPNANSFKERYAPGASSSSQELPMQSLRISPTQASTSDSHQSDDGEHEINLAAAAAAGEPTGNTSSREKWAESSKKRTCFGRVPRWALILIVILAIALGAVLGGVIGRYASHKHSMDWAPPGSVVTTTSLSGPDAASTVFATVTETLINVTPIPTIPADLPQLPTGTFGVPVGIPTDRSSSCLQNPPQTAWDCMTDPFMALNISFPLPAQVYLYSLTQGTDLLYGPQQPSWTEPCSLSLQYDKYDVNAGPAYVFQQRYNKTVILPENTFSPTSRREIDEEYERLEFEERDSGPAALQAYEKPWFCFWNGTVLEGFIYVNQTATPSSNATALLSSMMAEQATATMTGLPTSPSASTPYHAISGQDRQGSWPVLPQPLPKKVKIVERRVVPSDGQPTSPKPYCRQMQVLVGGRLGFAPNSENTIQWLNENESYVSRIKRVVAPRRPYWLREKISEELTERDSQSSCHCMWKG